MLVITRILHVAATFLLFGTLLVRAGIIAPAWAAIPARHRGPLPGRDRLLLVAALAAPLSLLAWLFFQAADMASIDIPSPGWVAATAALPTVLLQTWFGRVELARFACLLAVAALLLPENPAGSRRTATALLLGAAGVALPALVGHLASLETDRWWSVLLQALHLLAGAAWLGGLPALFLMLRRASPELASALSRRFSPLGIACVAVIVVSGTFNGYRLTESLGGLFGTFYGRMLLLKVALLLVLLGFAWHHRQRVTPALAGPASQVQRAAIVPRFARSVLAETLVGLLVVAVAGALASSSPAVHEQPLWPFPLRFSREVLDDPDLGPDLWRAVIAAAAAVALLGVAFRWRRLRWPALLAAILLGLYAQPQLPLLTAPAYPTSFQSSPTGFTAASIVAGQHLFAANCTACHGVSGQGNGPQAHALAVPPADLTAEHLWDHSDGDLFWWLSHGIAENGVLAMPGFADAIDEDGRWALIDYLHAHNAGLITGPDWQRPVAAPDVALSCPEGHSLALSDLHGSVILVALEPTLVQQAWLVTNRERLAAADIVPVLVRAGSGAEASLCRGDGADAATAYAILAGGQDGTAGTQFLIDPEGWLRLRRHGGWATLEDVLTQAATIRRQPMKAPAGMGMMHMG